MQEQPLWRAMICGDAAARTVARIGGATTERSPLPPGEAHFKNPLPPGEGRVRVVPQSSDRPAFARPDPHPDPLPEGEGGSVIHPFPEGEGGSVIAVFARSFYLADATGGLACIGPPGLGRGPLNMLCDLPRDLAWPARGLRPGIAGRRNGMILRIDGIGAFSLEEAVAWRPTIPSETWHRGILADGLASLPALAMCDRADGFAPLLAPLARRRLDEVAASATASPLLRVAAPGIAALLEWLAAGGKGAPGGAAEILIGLGPGLTPSGDDLLGGAMIALHALGRATVAARLAAWALPLAAERTGAISAAHLACAAAGEGSSALHDFLAALLTGDAAALAEAAVALGAIGHSSGWDMLAGATLACAAFNA
jgi:hypothetical protein